VYDTRQIAYKAINQYKIIVLQARSADQTVNLEYNIKTYASEINSDGMDWAVSVVFFFFPMQGFCVTLTKRRAVYHRVYCDMGA